MTLKEWFAQNYPNTVYVYWSEKELATLCRTSESIMDSLPKELQTQLNGYEGKMKWVVGWFLPINDINNALCEQWRLHTKRHYEGQDDYTVREYYYAQWFESLEMARLCLKNVTVQYYDTQTQKYRTHKPYLSRDYAI